MKIKDIVNRDIVNLTNCDQEPIHIPGSIQPHGFLLGITASFTIDYCSGNTADYISIPYNELLKKHIREVIGESGFSALNTYINAIAGTASAPLILALHNKQYNCSIHKSQELWISEFEPLSDEQPA